MRLGIQIAKAILAGDVSLARKLRDTGPRHWSVAECRAIAGACREANRRYGSELSLSQFLL